MTNDKNLTFLKPKCSQVPIHEILWPFVSLLKGIGFIIISKHDKLDVETPVFHYKLLSWTTIKAIAAQVLFSIICGGVLITS